MRDVRLVCFALFATSALTSTPLPPKDVDSTTLDSATPTLLSFAEPNVSTIDPRARVRDALWWQQEHNNLYTNWDEETRSGIVAVVQRFQELQKTGALGSEDQLFKWTSGQQTPPIKDLQLSTVLKLAKIAVILLAFYSVPVEASVRVEGDVTGLLTIRQASPPFGETIITGTLQGLMPGWHGFHVHQMGNLTEGCTSTGGHYNPLQEAHGGPNSPVRHVGDLGNILADGSGVAAVSITDSRVSLVGPSSVIGRAVVVHSGEDDLGLGGDEGSSTTGNAGARVGCGVIGHA